MAIRRDHAELFAFARTALTNARDEEDVQPLLADYGYDVEFLNEGIELLDNAEAAAQHRKMQYAAQLSASAAVNDAAALLRATYIRHVQLARIAFDRNSEPWYKLGLGGRRPHDLPRLLKRARTFYTVLLNEPKILGALGRFNIDQSATETGMSEVQAVDALLAVQRKQIGEAQVATVLRNDEVALLSGYMSDFVAVAKLALDGQPQLREKLGILERS